MPVVAAAPPACLESRAPRDPTRCPVVDVAPAPAAVAPAYFLIPTSSAIDTDLPIFSRTKHRW